MASTSPASSNPATPKAQLRGGAAPVLPAPGAERAAHLSDHLRVISERRWFLIAAFLFILGIGALDTFRQTPIYYSSGLLLIEPTRVDFAGVRHAYDPTDVRGRDYHETQYALIVSQRILEPVATELRRRGDAELEGFTARSLQQRVTVAPIRNTRLARVGFESPDPEEAAWVANAVIDSYIADNRRRQRGVTDSGLLQLRERAQQLRQRVEAAATAIDDFRREHGFFGIDDEFYSSLNARLEALNVAHAGAEAARITAEAQLEAFEALGASGGEVAGDVAGLRLQLARLAEEREAFSLHFKQDHPGLVAVETRIAAAQERLDELQRDQRETALLVERSGVRSARTAEAALVAAIDSLTRAQFEASTKLGAYRLLLREHQNAIHSHDRVLQRIEDLDLTALGGDSLAADRVQDTDNIFLLERALPPQAPIRPAPKKNLTYAALLGLLIGTLLCFFVDYLDRSLKSSAEVERVLGVSVLGFVPPVLAGPSGEPAELEALLDPRSLLAEAFRTIRTSVIYGVREPGSGNSRRLLVTSTLPRDGKTLVAANLSIALAQARKRVLLVEADLRRPRVSQLFGLYAEDGLSTILAGEAEVGEAANLTRPIEGLELLRVLPSGPIPPNPADLLDSERLGELLRFLDAEYDWIIFDSPPLSVADPAIILSRHVEHGLFVVRSHSTPRDLARQARDQLGAMGARLIGAVMNQANLSERSRAYGGYGGYGGYGREGAWFEASAAGEHSGLGLRDYGPSAPSPSARAE